MDPTLEILAKEVGEEVEDLDVDVDEVGDPDVINSRENDFLRN